MNLKPIKKSNKNYFRTKHRSRKPTPKVYFMIHVMYLTNRKMINQTQKVKKPLKHERGEKTWVISFQATKRDSINLKPLIISLNH